MSTVTANRRADALALSFLKYILFIIDDYILSLDGGRAFRFSRGVLRLSYGREAFNIVLSSLAYFIYFR